MTGSQPANNFILNEWSYHTSDLSQVTDPNSVSRHDRILGQFNDSMDSSSAPIASTFNPSSASSPRPSTSRGDDRSLLLRARHVQLALSESTQLDPTIDETVFESAGSASNPAFQNDDIDVDEMRIRNNDSSEVIIFERFINQ